MKIKHISVTGKQWQHTWNSLPPSARVREEESFRGQQLDALLLGRLVVYWDQHNPDSQWNEEVDSALAAVLAVVSGETFEREDSVTERNYYRDHPEQRTSK